MRLSDVLNRTIKQVKKERDQDKRDAIVRLAGALILSIGLHSLLLGLAFQAAS